VWIFWVWLLCITYYRHVMFWGKLHKNVVDNILQSTIFFSQNRALNEICGKMWYRQMGATCDNIIWCMQFAGWITKATYTHSEYVTLIAFLQQQWLHKCVSMLRSAYIATLVGLTQRFPTWGTNQNIRGTWRNWMMVERGT